MEIKNKLNNKIGFVFLATLLLIAGCSHNEKVNEYEPETIHKKLNEKHQFKVQGCVINYNGTDLYMSSGVAPWLKALGKNYRVVESTDVASKLNLYIYDDIGVSLMERQRDKKISMFGFYLPDPPNLIETPQDIENRKLIGDEAPKKRFKDAISINGILIGAYPMQSEIMTVFKSKSSVKYKYTADCTPDQEEKGEYFYIDLGTTFEEPEIVDSLFFYNYFDSMSDEEKKTLYRRTDENGREICDEFFDVTKMKVMPQYCTEAQLLEEKNEKTKK